MLSFLEKEALRNKIVNNSLSSEDEIGGGCIASALSLFDANDGGCVFWVGSLASLDIEPDVHHSYFVPPNAQDDDLALNHSDNGYGQYPPLTVREVTVIGKLQDIDILRQIVSASNSLE